LNLGKEKYHIKNTIFRELIMSDKTYLIKTGLNIKINILLLYKLK